jgi:hypothetical protein
MVDLLFSRNADIHLPWAAGEFRKVEVQKKRGRK